MPRQARGGPGRLQGASRGGNRLGLVGKSDWGGASPLLRVPCLGGNTGGQTLILGISYFKTDPYSWWLLIPFTPELNGVWVVEQTSWRLAALFFAMLLSFLFWFLFLVLIMFRVAWLFAKPRIGPDDSPGPHPGPRVTRAVALNVSSGRAPASPLRRSPGGTRLLGTVELAPHAVGAQRGGGGVFNQRKWQREVMPYG